VNLFYKSGSEYVFIENRLRRNSHTAAERK